MTGGSATVTVTDTLDTVTATLSVNSNSVTEGDQISYTVTLTGPEGMDLSQHGGLSFTLANGETVTIADGEISGTSDPVDTNDQSNIVNSIKSVAVSKEYEDLKTTGTTSVNVNLTPDLNSANAEGLEDSSGIEVKLSATDADGSVKSFIINSLPENGTLYLGDKVVTAGMEISADGEGELTLTFVPTKDWSGDTSFNYQAVDNAGAQSDNSSLNINVQPVTDVPKVTIDLGEPEGYNQKVNISNINLEGKSFTITAVKDGSEGTLAHVGFKKEGDVNGFGVGGKASNNNGDAREIDSSEKIVIEFKEPVTDLAVKFSWLATNEYAKYTVYDTAGNVIGSEIVRGINDKIHPELNISDKFPGHLIGRIEFTSAAKDDVYIDSQGNEQVIAHNNSDYVVHEVTYTVPDTKTYPLDITATPTDIDGSEEITSIIVKVPDGVELSHGTLIETRDGISSWELSLTSSQGYTVSKGENGAITISGVTITAGATDEFEVTVIATAEDGPAAPESGSATTPIGGDSAVGPAPEITGLGIEGGDLVLDESHLASGTQADAESLTQSGSFEVAASQGVKSLTIGGQVVISDGVFNETTITSPLDNTLTITSYNPETGVIEYSYTLNKSNDHSQGVDDALFDEFDVQLEQNGGGSANASLSVKIVDDAPTVTFTNAESASTVINGFWSAEAGADTLSGFEMIKQIAFNGVTVGNGAVVEGSLQFSESNVDGVYQGSFSYNADEGGVKEVTFTLTLSDDGSYQIELSAVPVSISITPEEFDKAAEAAGPTDTYDISYKNTSETAQVRAVASGQELLLTGINANSGEQQTFEATTIGGQINVSGQGIGFKNNNLISHKDLTTESLIYDPTEAASAISLFFKEKGEPAFGVVSRDVLYLTVTGTKGSTQTIMLDSGYGDFVVGADGELTAIDEGVYTGGELDGYTVNNPFGTDEAIDHLEVTAGFYVYSQGQNDVTGTTNVKVNFGFSTEQEQALPLPVEMDFTATVTDADGDTTEASFTVGMQASGPIEGTDENDAITGTEDSDWLAGGLGDDIIDLGAGDGAMDIVYWSAEEAQSGQSQSDIVKGFELNEDKLDLSDFLTDDEQNDLSAHLSAVGDGDNTVVKVTSDSGAELNITLDGVGYDADILSQILVDELVSKLPDSV